MTPIKDKDISKFDMIYKQTLDRVRSRADWVLVSFSRSIFSEVSSDDCDSAIYGRYLGMAGEKERALAIAASHDHVMNFVHRVKGRIAYILCIGLG